MGKTGAVVKLAVWRGARLLAGYCGVIASLSRLAIPLVMLPVVSWMGISMLADVTSRFSADIGLAFSPPAWLSLRSAAADVFPARLWGIIQGMSGFFSNDNDRLFSDVMVMGVAMIAVCAALALTAFSIAAARFFSASAAEAAGVREDAAAAELRAVDEAAELDACVRSAPAGGKKPRPRL